MVDVAQLVRASVCGTEGRGFESRLPPFFLNFKFYLLAFRKLCNIISSDFYINNDFHEVLIIYYSKCIDYFSRIKIIWDKIR